MQEGQTQLMTENIEMYHANTNQQNIAMNKSTLIIQNENIKKDMNNNNIDIHQSVQQRQIRNQVFLPKVPSSKKIISIQESPNKIRSIKKIKLPPIVKQYDQNLSSKSNDLSLSKLTCNSPLAPIKKLPHRSYYFQNTQNKQKLKDAYHKKNHLLEKLHKLDTNLKSIRNEHQLAESQLQQWQDKKMKQTKLAPYRTKIKFAKQNISPQKHKKNIQLLQKLNAQKLERQERLLTQFKKRTQDQFRMSSLIELEKIYGTKTKKGIKNQQIRKKIDKMNQKMGKYPQTVNQQQGFGFKNTGQSILPKVKQQQEANYQCKQEQINSPKLQIEKSDIKQLQNHQKEKKEEKLHIDQNIN